MTKKIIAWQLCKIILPIMKPSSWGEKTCMHIDNSPWFIVKVPVGELDVVMRFEESKALLRTRACWWRVGDTVWLDWCVVYGVCPKWGEYVFDDVFVVWLSDKWDGLARRGKGLWLRL